MDDGLISDHQPEAGFTKHSRAFSLQAKCILTIVYTSVPHSAKVLLSAGQCSIHLCVPRTYHRS